MALKAKQTLGKREFVDFPDLGLFRINAKIDTGAYTPALHCHAVRLKEEKGRPVLCFIPLGEHDGGPEKEYCFSEFRKKQIRNSFGDTEERYMIRTRIRIGRRMIHSLISLSDRGGMRYPVLIGRKLLKKRFIVDVEQEHVGRKFKPKKGVL
mgnify:CR=1 FL=1